MAMTRDMLLYVFPGAPDVDTWVEAINAACERFGMTSPNAIASLLGITGNETGGFRQVKQELSYFTTPWSRVAGVFSGVIGLNESVYNRYKALGKQGFDEAFFNHVYDDNRRPAHAKIGSNTQPGDGYRFRGRGIIQMTGRGNYTACAAALGIDLANNPDLIMEPRTSALSAAWFIVENARILPLFESGSEADFIKGAAKVGLAVDANKNRLAYRRKALEVLGMYADTKVTPDGNRVIKDVSQSTIIKDSNKGTIVATAGAAAGAAAPVVTALGGIGIPGAIVLSVVVIAIVAGAIFYFTKVKKARRKMNQAGIA